MSLEKSITLPSGVTGNYLKITKPIPDKERLLLEVCLNLYLDAAHKDGEPLKRNIFRFQFQVADASDLNGNIYALSYSLIKAKNDPDLDGAVDV